MSFAAAAELKLVQYTQQQRAKLEAYYNAFEPKGAALGLPPRTPEGVHEWIQSLDKYPSFLALDGEEIAGHALLCPETYTGEVAVFVKEGYRGQGIGKRLLQALIATALEMDLRRIWGITEPDNVPMLRLAHACGFMPGKEMGEFSLDLSNLRPLPMAHREAKSKAE